MTQVIPSKKGQVVRIYRPLSGEDPFMEYVVAEDPSGFENNRQIMIVPVKELQKVATVGGIPFSDRVEKGDLTVIREAILE